MRNCKPGLTEGELKFQVGQYLEVGQNQGRWYFDRLNSGEIIAVAGDRRRRIKLCRPGTADFMVFYIDKVAPMTCGLSLVFIETKGHGTRFTPEQQEFAEAVEAQGAGYYLLESIEELERILPLGIVDYTQTT